MSVTHSTVSELAPITTLVVEELSTEMLLHIFQYLDGRNLMKCRRVCIRWRAIIHNCYKDTFWEKQCALDFDDVYESAFSRAELIWRELYNSLTLWQRSARGSVRLHKLKTLGKVKDFHVLKDGVVSCYYKRRHRRTVSIYDLETQEQVKTYKIDGKRIRKHYQNDDFIVYQHRSRGQKYIRVISKTDSATRIDEVIYPETKWKVYRNSVYYIHRHVDDRDLYLKRITANVIDGSVTFHLEYLTPWTGSLDDVVVVGEYIYVLQGHDIERDRLNRSSIVRVKPDGTRFYLKVRQVIELDEYANYGFLWTTPSTLSRVRASTDYKQLRRHDVNTALLYGNMLLTARKKKPIIDVFPNPYYEGKLVLNRCKPSAVICLKTIDGFPRSIFHIFRRSHITRLEVVEILCGHRIIFLYGGKLLILDIVHEEELVCAEELSQAESERYLTLDGRKPFNLNSLKLKLAPIKSPPIPSTPEDSPATTPPESFAKKWSLKKMSSTSAKDSEETSQATAPQEEEGPASPSSASGTASPSPVRFWKKDSRSERYKKGSKK